MDKFFDHPGLCHIGEKIFKNLVFQTQLACRLVRKSWNIVFEKESLKINLEDLQIQLVTEKEDLLNWSDFLKESETYMPNFLMKSYLQNITRKEPTLFRKEYPPWKPDYMTPLLAFSTVGYSKMVQIILNMNPITMCEKCVGLCIAAENGHINVVKRLKVIVPPTMPLGVPYAIILAAKNGDLEMVKVLTEDFPDSIDDVVIGRTIRAAACSGKIEMMKYFEQKLSRKHFRFTFIDGNENDETIFHHVAKEGHLEMLKHLCEITSRNPNQKDFFGQRPIHYAAEKGHLDIVKFLASYTQDPNAPDNSGRTPLMIAKSLGFTEIEEFLLTFPFSD